MEALMNTTTQITNKNVKSALMSDADFDAECPILDAEVQTCCAVCNKKYTLEEFLALGLPRNGKGEWSYPDSTVSLAVRQCTCRNTLARRMK
jgi:hypothetical protein